MRKFLKEYPLLVAIVVCGFMIRLIAGYTQSFSNDELSALYRIQFSGFSDLLHWGVKVDGHPALVQLFLYFYVPLVPESELFIRLPFILASTVSLVYFFRGFSQWVGNFTAYMVVIVLAFSGFSIQLGYFARPYAFGILFIAMAFYYWVQIFILHRSSVKYLVFFFITSVLACYTHYFALLQVAVFGLTALLFAPLKEKIRISILGILIILAFLPHYFITSYQLSVGGIGQWLGAPKPYFIIDMVMEFFDRSPIFLTLIVMIPALGVIKQGADPKVKQSLILFLLFVIPFLVLYNYSVKINPLLQYSACFFLFPFLLGCFFSLFGDIDLEPKWIKYSFVSLLVFLTVHEVFVYRVFSRIHFGEFKKIGEYIEEHEEAGVTTVVAVNNPFYIDYYLDSKQPDLYITDMGSNLHFLRTFVDTSRSDHFIYAFVNQNSNPEVLNMIADKYPYRQYSSYYMNAEIHHFTKIPGRENENSNTRLAYGFDPVAAKFSAISSVESGKWIKPFSVSANQEFSPAFEMDLDELALRPNENIVASVKFDTYPTCDVQLVLSIEKGPKVFWRSRKSSLQYSKYPGRTLTIAESPGLADIELEGARLKVYIWNPDKCDIQANSFILKITKGNPFSTGYSQ